MNKYQTPMEQQQQDILQTELQGQVFRHLITPLLRTPFKDQIQSHTSVPLSKLKSFKY